MTRRKEYGVSCLGIFLGLLCFTGSLQPFPIQTVSSQENPRVEEVKHFTLEEAINRALTANRTIAAAIDNLSHSEFSLLASKSDFELRIIPEIYLDLARGHKDFGTAVTLDKTLSTGTRVSVSPTLQKAGSTYETGVDVTLSQPLLRGFSTNYNLQGVKQSEYLLRSSHRDLYLTQVNVVLATVSAVYDVIRRREILRLQQSSYDRSLGYTEAAVVKQRMGMATAIDVYRAKIKLSQAESLLVTSREAFQDALDNLRIILAVPLEQAIDVSAPLSYTLIDVEEGEALRLSLKERMEALQIEDLIAILEIQSDAAKHNILPDVDLTLKYSSKGSDSSLKESIKSNSGSVELGLVSSGNVSRTREKAVYEQSRIAISSALRLLDLKKDEIKREVKFSLRNLFRTEENIEIQREQIEQSKGKLELAKVKFSRGLASNFDLIEAESELRTAEINLISAVIQYIEGQYQLKAAMGVLIDKQGKVTS